MRSLTSFHLAFPVDDLADRLQARGLRFVIEPGIRFARQVGEQATLFFLNPAGHALAFKTFRDRAQRFAQ
jgi:extradiol dioxygenase family protein